MIHNPDVNKDLVSHGVDFLFDTNGSVRIPIDTLTPDDVVLVPAFGTTIEIEQLLEERGLKKYFYDTTCPFVSKVWKRAKEIGSQGGTIIVHGKRSHEETRATISHAKLYGKVLAIENKSEAEILAKFLNKEVDFNTFSTSLPDAIYSVLSPDSDFESIGVVNQTTMLATETQEIIGILKESFSKHRALNKFIDTSDTLCYATYENQSATKSLTSIQDMEFVFVVGGEKSSNTTHLVEILDPFHETFFIRNAESIKSRSELIHFNIHEKKHQTRKNWITKQNPVIGITSGASCPDSHIDALVERLGELFEDTTIYEEAVLDYTTV